jgi:outer membrane protein assembly factor BamB
MNHAIRCATVLALGLILTLTSRAQEWSRFRGPNGSGIADAPTVPAAFTDKDYIWNIALPGSGHSSPVLWGDRIYVTCSDKETALRTVLCLNTSDGGVIWKREFPSHPYKQHNDNNYASSTPTVDEKHVYIAWSTPEEYALTALDAVDGKDAWHVPLGRYISQHGSGTSPIVVGDTVLLGNDQEGPHSSIFGIDRNNGHINWERDRATPKQGGMSAATPVLLKNIDGTEQAVFCSRGEGISGLDPRSGNVVWQAKDVFKFRTVGSPVAMGDKVAGFSGEGPNGHEFLVVKPSGSKVTTAYELKEATPYVPTPLYLRDMLFTLSDTGTVTCYQAASGKRLWQQRIGTEYYSSLVCTGEKIYAVSKKGVVTCFAAKDTFEKLGESKLGELCHATPAISGGRMYLRTLTHLICVGGK